MKIHGRHAPGVISGVLFGEERFERTCCARRTAGLSWDQTMRRGRKVLDIPGPSLDSSGRPARTRTRPSFHVAGRPPFGIAGYNGPTIGGSCVSLLRLSSFGIAPPRTLLALNRIGIDTSSMCALRRVLISSDAVRLANMGSGSHGVDIGHPHRPSVQHLQRA